MAHNAIAVANEFISKFGENSNITPMKLQKLVYFANGWWLAVKGEPLVDELPQVWRYGPVFQSVYRGFKRFGQNPIDSPLKVGPFASNALLIKGGKKEKELIAWIWKEYGHLSGPALSDETHKAGTPWRNIAESKNFTVRDGEVIPTKEDWVYFAALAKEQGLETTVLNS